MVNPKQICPDCKENEHLCRCVATIWCKDCLHFQEERMKDLCYAPELTDLDPSTGGRIPQFPNHMRQNMMFRSCCGVKARYFTPRTHKAEVLDRVSQWEPTSLELILSFLLIGAALHAIFG